MIRNLFAYGTLMCDDIIAAVAGHTPVSVTAVLKNHRRLRVRGEHYPGLTRHRGGQVEGVLYRALEPAVWARIDRFEGLMYERVRVTVELCDGTLAHADTYRVRPKYENRLEPVEWDFQAFLDVGKQGFVREYAGYESVRAQSD